MKAFVLIFILIVGSNAAPLPEEAQARILQYDNKNDGRGNYDFSFETSDGITRSESGTLVNEGQPDEHIDVQGYYAYTDPDGKYVEIRYTADENGYRIREPLVPMVVQTSPAVVATLLG